MRIYISPHWQDEAKSQPPDLRRDGYDDMPKIFKVRGYMGLVNRAYTAGEHDVTPAIGITSWGKAPIILSSDENFAANCANWMMLRAAHSNRTPDQQDDFDKTGNGNGKDNGIGMAMTQITMGHILKSQPNPRIVMSAVNGIDPLAKTESAGEEQKTVNASIHIVITNNKIGKDENLSGQVF